GLGFLQKPDDLLFRKALLHVRLLLRKRTLLDSGWPCLQGAGHPHQISVHAGPRGAETRDSVRLRGFFVLDLAGLTRVNLREAQEHL
ncbi:hypothetical protein LGM14_27295, partial [Burkholderia multivorans]|nr:hypothetical protein [Burkholderia multivorans]